MDQRRRLIDALMSGSLLPGPRGSETEVRTRLGSPGLMVEQFAPTRQHPPTFAETANARQGFYPRALYELKRLQDVLGGPPSIGQGINLAMAAIPGGRGRPPRLPMDEASRMARARAMDYRVDKPVYGSIAPESERIAQAAIKIGDRVFTGPSHFLAIKKAEAALGAPIDNLPLAPIPDGFVTSAGRYVSRYEAEDIAARTGQVSRRSTRPGFMGPASEDVRMSRSINPSTAGVNTGATAPGLPGGGGGVWLALEPGGGTSALLARAARPVGADVRGATLPEIHSTLAAAWDRGHDAVLLKNYTTPAGQTGNFLVVRDRPQLRDPSATFDPAKRDSPDILAGLGGLGLFAPLAGSPLVTAAPQQPAP